MWLIFPHKVFQELNYVQKVLQQVRYYLFISFPQNPLHHSSSLRCVGLAPPQGCDPKVRGVLVLTDVSTGGHIVWIRWHKNICFTLLACGIPQGGVLFQCVENTFSLMDEVLSSEQKRRGMSQPGPLRVCRNTDGSALLDLLWTQINRKSYFAEKEEDLKKTFSSGQSVLLMLGHFLVSISVIITDAQQSTLVLLNYQYHFKHL